MPASPSRTRRRVAASVALVALLAVLTACLPAEPSAGRNTPVKKVLILGDSITFGLYGATPQVHEPLGRMMMKRGITLLIDGFPGENPIDAWPGHPRWSERLQWVIDTQDPDVVVIQSILFVGAGDPARQEAYRSAVTQLYDIAQSRGAHTYIVAHHAAPDPVAHNEMAVAQRLQAEAAAGRGISTIPLDWWLAHCNQPFVADGWHLSANGEECHANAVVAAVDQLRKVVG